MTPFSGPGLAVHRVWQEAQAGSKLQREPQPSLWLPLALRPTLSAIQYTILLSSSRQHLHKQLLRAALQVLCLSAL